MENIMLKTPRFMKEYASYQKKFIEKNVLNKESGKRSIERIDMTLRHYELGLLTVTEAMDLITNV